MDENPFDDELDDDYGVLLVNPRRARTRAGRFKKTRKRRRKRRRNPVAPVAALANPRRRRRRRTRRRNPVLVTANPRRRRRRSKRRRSYSRRRRNPFGLGGGFIKRSTAILTETGAFLMGDLLGHALMNAVWQKAGVGAWVSKQAWAQRNVENTLGLGRIAIGLLSEPFLRYVKVPANLRKWMVRANVFQGALMLTAGFKRQALQAVNLDGGMGDYMRVDGGVGDYMRIDGGMGEEFSPEFQLPSDADVEASFSGHYGGGY